MRMSYRVKVSYIALTAAMTSLDLSDLHLTGVGISRMSLLVTIYPRIRSQSGSFHLLYYPM